MAQPVFPRRTDDECTPIITTREQAEFFLRQIETRANRYDRDGKNRDFQIAKFAIEQCLDHNNFDYINAFTKLRHIPATIDEFIESKEYLGGRIDIWPKLRPYLNEMKPDIMLGKQPILEVLNRSTIGTGKSELGKLSILYDMYVLSCFKKPQLLFNGINDLTPMVFAVQSIRDQITRRVIYKPLRQAFVEMPYTKKWIRYNKDLESELILENNIQLVPMIASNLSVLGQAIIGGHLDEVNFMEVIAESKRVAGPMGLGGLYDQAQEIYRGISKRRKSRFITKGPNPGTIYVSSSVNYEQDFLDRRIAEVNAEKDKHIMIMDLRQFEVKPDTFSGKTFKFLVGTNEYAPKILTEESKPNIDYPASGKIEYVPVELEEDFRTDPEKSQRDFLGIASAAVHRFIAQTHKIVEAVMQGRELQLPQYVRKLNLDLSLDGYPQVEEDLLPLDRHLPRFVHIDLSRSSDRVGIAIAKIAGITAIERNGVTEMLPTVIVETAISIEPSQMNHIDISEVRGFVTLLKTFYGINIKSVTYDGFDSQESIQLLKKAGISSYEISMDRTPEAYQQFKESLYQNRIVLPDNDLLRNELATLERHQKGDKVKIDHPPRGSKDIADAVVGAVRAAVLDRTVRSTKTSTPSQANGTMDIYGRRDANRRDPIRR